MPKFNFLTVSFSGEMESSLDFDDHFVAKRVLGEGGFGTVVLATNKLDGADYAIKQVLIRRGGISFEEAKREVEALAQLNHPHIVNYKIAWRSEKCIGGAMDLSKFFLIFF